MRRRHRHAHRRYGSYEQPPRMRRKVLGTVVILIVFFILMKWTFAFFNVGNTIHRHGTLLTMERLGNVQVSIEGGALKRAENEQKLYPGDRVTTGVGARALLSFFDETAVRLNEFSDVIIEESFSGENESEISLTLTEGNIWLITPNKTIYSGAIVRTITTPRMEASIPPGTESVVTAQSIVVFTAEGIGTTIKPNKGVIPIIVGEGQKLTLPPNISKDTDLYVYRSPLDPSAMQSELVKDSRAVYSGMNTKEVEEIPVSEETEEPLGEEDEALVVLAPDNDKLVTTATVDVRGRVGGRISRVRVNGYNAPIEEGSGVFNLELALPDEDEVEIVIVALDEGDTVLTEVRRKVLRDRKPPSAPIIISPAKSGQTYRTNSERFIIEGTTSSDTVGISVNDYRLQLYKPGNTTWTYLASTSIDNLHPGKNVYSIVTINKGGYKSEPAVLTILLEDGPVGVIEEEGGEEGEPSEEEEEKVEEEISPPATTELPNNRPLKSGSLQVIGPTPGTTHNATGSSFLIEGTTVAETDSLWVNDYRLRLYESGKTTWNYIADTDLGTLHRGRNVYNIITRDSRGRILDELQYVVQFRPGRD